MSVSEQVQVWGLIFAAIAVIGALIASVYFALHKRPVEIAVLALLARLFRYRKQEE